MSLDATDSVPALISPKTRYIISTSGRLSSCRRYQKLLQELLKVDVAYVSVHSMSCSSEKIDPQEFAWALRGMPCIGGAISRDIKQAIIPYLDDLDPIARDIGSVNTVIRTGKLLKGYNTDALGFRQAILAGLGPNINKVDTVVCYGYGGVTNVVVHVLKSLGKAVYITGRRPDVVQQKAEELEASVWSEDIAADMFINAAPVTDRPLENALMFLDAIRGCKFVFDHEMPGRCLVEYCTDNGVSLIRGEEMYKPQMEAQWSLFLEPYLTDPSVLPRLLSECC